MGEGPIVEQTSLTVVHTTPGGAVILEVACGCHYRAARVTSVSPLPVLQSWVRLRVSRVMPTGNLVAKDGRGGEHLLAGVSVERLCPRHRGEYTISGGDGGSLF